MLVLSRKIGETLKLGEHITVKVVKVAGKVVRLAIEAPEEVVVRRGELVEPGRNR